MLIAVRWHQFWHKDHFVYAHKVSVPSWDMSAKGWYIKCSCGKDWAY